MKNRTRFAIVLMLSSPAVAAAASPPEPAGDVISTPAAPASLAPPATQLRYELP
jgi:hypothetical protein